MVKKILDEIRKVQLSPLDYLPQKDLREKLVDLVLRGVPENVQNPGKKLLTGLRNELLSKNVENVRVVVFGGGTGLSNLIGGDSRRSTWIKNPFCGLKEVFPNTSSIVCVTDDGGSTGELLKDLPLIAIGDIRHVLLSSIKLSRLKERYSIVDGQADEIAKILHQLFNYRSPGNTSLELSDLAAVLARLDFLPSLLKNYIEQLVSHLFSDPRLTETLNRPHCFGNLLVVAAVYREINAEIDNAELADQPDLLQKALFTGLNRMGEVLGAGERAVMPCTTTLAELKVRYTNGVESVGEDRLSKAERGVPVESVHVNYFDDVRVHKEVYEEIARADIIILAPGSLYSSIIPVFKVAGMADVVRKNRRALKILISNLWVQAGETDLSIADPERKFHVSDMIRAYEKNILGGTEDLFNEVICVSLENIPASILQRYAVEGKIPIFLDREVMNSQHYYPIECGVYSRYALKNNNVIQHDPDTLAQAVLALFNGRKCFGKNSIDEGCKKEKRKESPGSGQLCYKNPVRRIFCSRPYPFQRYNAIKGWLDSLEIAHIGCEKDINIAQVKENSCEVLWSHPVIPLAHLEYVKGLHCIDKSEWNRDQRWDNVFSFYDPEDCCIKIREDQFGSRSRFEVALMIALGESLLGNYAGKKEMEDIKVDGQLLGRAYHLYLRNEKERSCFFDSMQLDAFLKLARMCSTEDENHYTRLVNRGEGFTPPGLLMGLMYAWYLDNRLATHIEYKMSVMKISSTDLIPEQLKMSKRRKRMIMFFRDVVFGHECEKSIQV